MLRYRQKVKNQASVKRDTNLLAKHMTLQVQSENIWQLHILHLQAELSL